MNFASLQHSVFLQALGDSIINSLWQGFILWLIYETISISYKNASSKFKNNCSTILLFVSFTWFCLSFIFTLVNKETIVTNNQLPESLAAQIIPEVTGFKLFIKYAISSVPYLSIAYIFLLFFLMAKLVTAYRHVYTISNKRLISAPIKLQSFTSTVALEIGITRKIRIWISEYIDVPATIGFFKPVILIPVASINNLTGHQLEAIILHELSHIKRNDYLINLVISVIETMLFFNPFIILLSNVIKRERENCCDDFVLQYQYDPHAYATALLHLEQARVKNIKLAIGSVSGKNQLLSRIKRITNSHSVSKQFNYGQKLLALFLVTGIICSVAWLSPKQKKSSEMVVAKKMQNSKKKSGEKEDDSSNMKAIAKSKQLNEKILKQITIKNEEPDFQNLNSSGFVQKDFFDSGNKKDNSSDFLFEENNDENFAEKDKSNEAFFSFEEEGIKLPQSVDIQNFPFQKMDFNIDLGNIDTKQLNENLKKAYKEINSLNWSKVQSDINQSFSELNRLKVFREIQAKLFSRQKQALSQLKNVQKDFEKKSIVLHIDKEIHDSLISNELFTVNDKAFKLQKKLDDIQRQYAINLKSNFSFNYDVSDQDKVIDRKPAYKSSFGYDESLHKKIKITINHLPQSNSVSSNRKLLQLSFNNSSEELQQGDKNISIEIDTK